MGRSFNLNRLISDFETPLFLFRSVLFETLMTNKLVTVFFFFTFNRAPKTDSIYQGQVNMAIKKKIGDGLLYYFILAVYYMLIIVDKIVSESLQANFTFTILITFFVWLIFITIFFLKLQRIS